MLLYTFLGIAIVYVLSTWAIVLHPARWSRLGFGFATTIFVPYTLFMLYDFAQWEGRSHIVLLNLINALAFQIGHLK